jgi:uncharacterized repeat protein (TIGR03803 family)
MFRINRMMIASLSMIVLTATALHAQTLTTLATFDGPNGWAPDWSTVVQGLDGNFYGTTLAGGANSAPSGDGAGTFFRVTPDGTLTTLYNFCSLPNCADGYNPLSGVILGTDGNFYGTTYQGGTGGIGYTVSPYGTVFKITSTGVLTTLYSFCSVDPNVCTDGASPRGGVIQAADGNFYGITPGGNSGTGANGGTVYSITPSGVLTTLYYFCSQPNCADGSFAGGESQAALVQGTDGNFYGTTNAGGANNDGTVFKLDSSSFAETVLYSFCSKKNCTDGAVPEAGLVQASNGEFYGVTPVRGSASDDGTIFKISSAGVLKTLYYPPVAGSPIFGGLMQATDGNLYGTISGGGTNNEGTLFKMTLSGVVTTVYNFCSLGQPDCADGAVPWATPFQGTDGNFYGTTQYGGASGEGTVYSLSTGLVPFVKLYPTSGADGASVTILGTNLSGATKVTFDGKKATFTIVSDSEITTTVPTGAKTGKVSVTTPSGTLKSNVAFQVTP